MRALSAVAYFCVLVAGVSPALADPCPGKPDALGTSRVISVDPAEHARIGTMQYHETLPLADKEVVLTFDDGPLPPYTERILQTLAAECVKATFFMVGRMARAYPDMVRRVYNEGHTVATHSQNHPIIFTRLSLQAAENEIEQGQASVAAALGDPRAMAPFFRFPGLGRSNGIEAYLSQHHVMAWSADFLADDWRRITSQKVLKLALDRLEQKGKGILLLHDIQPRTVLMLPTLLRELKARGYHIVQVVPAGENRPKTVAPPETWVMHNPAPPVWPRLLPPAPRADQAPANYPQAVELPITVAAAAKEPGEVKVPLLEAMSPRRHYTWPMITVAFSPAEDAQTALVANAGSSEALAVADAGVAWSAGRIAWPGVHAAAKPRLTPAIHARPAAAVLKRNKPRSAAITPPRPPRPPSVDVTPSPYFVGHIPSLR